MKKDCKVKAHRRKGKMVKSHSRSIKTSTKPEVGTMTKEECKAKYDAMVAKYGEDSPQAKKLAIKMEGMETVEKDSRFPKSKVGALPKRKSKNPMANGFTKEEAMDALKNGRAKKVKKHSRGSYMRKGIEEEVLTKESRKKLALIKGKSSKEEFTKKLELAKGKAPITIKDIVGNAKPSDKKGKSGVPKATPMHKRMAELRAMRKNK